ncbi:O-phosphoseryl-tRNA(Sec) selenium transferase, SepSecS [Popillia japonica]|uniref:O-phosphoseryl-tRNA(Sec) selenium transferase n=1 Tax=Popillia japonica TaxID=7064 RepID=A0AAW1KK05_POPJA
MANQDKIIQLFEQKIPHLGWDMRTIDYLLSYMSSMDCNNFINKANVGEREGRCISDLVAKRNLYFTHGIGRSGDLTESQPKAIGSSILYKLTNHNLKQ